LVAARLCGLGRKSFSSTVASLGLGLGLGP
jgi:hypothetical protein